MGLVSNCILQGSTGLFICQYYYYMVLYSNDGVVLSNGKCATSGRKERINKEHTETQRHRVHRKITAKRRGGNAPKEREICGGAEARPCAVRRAFGFPWDIKMNTMYAEVVDYGRREDPYAAAGGRAARQAG